MAKYISDATVTVENAIGRFVFKAQSAGISSTNGGLTHNVSVSPDAQMVEKGVPYSIPFNKGGFEPKVSAASVKREAVIKHVLLMAKAVDKQEFESARLIEQAVEEANQAHNKKMHQFQLAVLSALHEGINSTEVDAVLMDANLPDFTDEVSHIVRRDMRSAYLTSEDFNGED